MAKETSYYELLKDPRWQRKRLEIMKLNNFSCEVCGDEEKTLNIHHSYYEKGLKPWDYPEQSLHCLCEDCHKKAQDIKTLINRQLGQIDLTENEIVLGYLLGLQMSDVPMIVAEVFSYEVALGIGDAFKLAAEQVLDSLIDGKIDGWKLDEIKKRNRN
jgi:hypothetical protein